MLTDEERARILRAHRLGMSIRAIARRFHHGRTKIREVLRNEVPVRYRRTKVYRPKLTEAYRRRIVDLIAEEASAASRTRRSAATLYRILQEEGYEGGYDQVRRLVARLRDEQTSPKPR